MSYGDETLTKTVDELGLESVTSVAIGDYEWAQIDVYYSAKDDRFFWYSDSGCSCYYFAEDFGGAADFQDGDRAAAIAAIKSFFENSYADPYGETPAKYVDAVRDFRPSAVTS